jgi:hypothetical protein
METVIQQDPQAGHHQKTLVVRVRYITSRKQYVDPQVQQDETLAAFKPRVLLFFDLAEGSTDGGSKTYHFANEGTVLNNLGATIGSLADGKHELKLDLIERFEQG